MITINASFVDTIDRLLFRRKQLTKVHSTRLNKSADLNTLSKEELISILTSCENYYFEGGYIEYSILPDQDYIDKEIEYINKSIAYDISRLQKWCDSKEEYRDQIMTYLKHHNIEIKELV